VYSLKKDRENKVLNNISTITI